MYMYRVRFSKLGCNILINSKDRPIVCLTAIRYIGSIGLFRTHLVRVAIISMSAEFQQDSSKIEEHVCVKTRNYGHTDRQTWLARLVVSLG